MIQVTTNIKQVAVNLYKRIAPLTDESKDKLAREMATTVCALMKERIHEQGKASDGSQIGSYKDSYMRTRKKYNRGTSRKVILSLTGQMENDFSLGVTDPIKTQDGYGIGFKNPINFDKSQWNEERFDKNIYSLTADEKNAVMKIAEDFINRPMNKI